MKIKENIIMRLDQSRYGYESIKFEEIYDSVDECINDLKQITNSTIEKKLKGYSFLLGFKRTILMGRELTDKQIIQLKRLSSEVARGYYLDNKNILNGEAK